MALEPACFGGALGASPVGAGALGSGAIGGIWQANAVNTFTIEVSTAYQPSALANPALWTVTPVGPGAPVAVTAVVELTPNTRWRLTVDPGMTPGGLEYEIAVNYAAAGGEMTPECASIVIDSPLSVVEVDFCQGGALGTAPAGAGALGSGIVGGLYTAAVLDAFTVDVFTVPLPPAVMLQLAAWSVVPLGGGAPVAVTAVVEIAAGTQWRLTVAPAMTGGPYLVSFDAAAVGAGGLISVACRSVEIEVPAPDTGAVPAPALAYADEPYDIANPNLIRDAGLVDPPPLGQHQINDRGDFALDSRLQGLRKRILRRASTPLNGFALMPGYGFAKGVKSTIRPSQLQDLAADAKIQVEREPEVVRAQVFMQQLRNSPGVVVQAIRARTITGLDVVASQQIDLRPPGSRRSRG